MIVIIMIMINATKLSDGIFHNNPILPTNTHKNWLKAVLPSSTTIGGTKASYSHYDPILDPRFWNIRPPRKKTRFAEQTQTGKVRRDHFPIILKDFLDEPPNK